MPLRLVYLGNLGLAHDVPLLRDFFIAARRHAEVSITFFGTAESSLQAVRQMAITHGVKIGAHPHVDFPRLKEVLAPLDFNFGVVTLAEEFFGLLSPSKFSGYLAAEIPVLYLGPPETNTGLVCDRFGAGIRMDRQSLRSEAGQAKVAEICAGSPRTYQTGIEAARAYFDQFNGSYLAEEILRRTKSA